LRSVWGAKSIQVGLPLQDIVPSSSYAAGFFRSRDQYYGAYKSGIVTGYKHKGFVQLNYSDIAIQKKIFDMELKMDKVHGTDPVYPMYRSSIWDRFYRWFNLQIVSGSSDVVLTTLGIPAVALADTSPEAMALNFTLYITSSAGQPYTPYCSPCYFAKADYFELLMHIFLSSASEGLASLEQIERDYNFFPPKIYTFRIIFVQGTVYTDPDAVSFITQSRRVTDGSGIPSYPGGFVYDLYEQYIHVNEYLGQQMGYIAIGIFFGSFIFLFHPGAVVLMCLMVAVIITEIYGFLYFFGLKMNGVCVINLVFSLGNGVEVVSHVMRHFLITPGTRLERAQVSVAKLIFPIAFSQICAFLGVLPLNFATFPYFILYFFYQYVIILVLCLLNGLAILPAVLSVIGPPALSTVSVKDAATEVELPALEEGEEEIN